MVACPVCRSPNPDAATVCGSCGTSLKGPAHPRVQMRVVRADGGPEAIVAMRGELLTCGKLGDIAMPDDPFVAATQARFYFSNSRLAIEDVAGGNGVFMRVRQERDVPLGTELRLGRQRLVLEAVPPATPVAGTVMWGSPDPGYRARLVQILEGGLRGAAFPLKEGENQVGREAGDVAFPGDGFVSGRHALFRVHQDRVSVQDLGSSNGTFIRLGAPSYVAHGDQFLIGRQLVRVEIA